MTGRRDEDPRPDLTEVMTGFADAMASLQPPLREALPTTKRARRGLEALRRLALSSPPPLPVEGWAYRLRLRRRRP